MCSSSWEKKMKNIDMKYQKRGRKKVFFHILFLYVWRMKMENKVVYYKMIFVLLSFKSINPIYILRYIHISVTDRVFDFKYYHFYILNAHPVKILLKSFCLGISKVVCWTGVHNFFTNLIFLWQLLWDFQFFLVSVTKLSNSHVTSYHISHCRQYSCIFSLISFLFKYICDFSVSLWFSE